MRHGLTYHLLASALLLAGGFITGLSVRAVPPQIEFVDRPVEVEVPYQVEHRVEVPGPERIVEVPGPTRPVYVDRPGPARVVVKKVPARCPSIADALNHYEALR